MWPSRPKMIHFPSGETSSDIHVPSLVSKSISRVAPRAFVVSHSAGGFSCAAVQVGTRSAMATSQLEMLRTGPFMRLWAVRCIKFSRDEARRTTTRQVRRAAWPVGIAAISVGALYHAGATNATTSRESATFVSLHFALIDFAEIVCCTHRILFPVEASYETYDGRRFACARGGCEVSRGAAANQPRRRPASSAVQGHHRQCEVCLRSCASGCPVAPRKHSRSELIGLLWQRHSEARRYDGDGERRQSSYRTFLHRRG